eukprot:773117-Pleurochrysis_carterae.AAC.1
MYAGPTLRLASATDARVTTKAITAPSSHRRRLSRNALVLLDAEGRESDDAARTRHSQDTIEGHALSCYALCTANAHQHSACTKGWF